MGIFNMFGRKKQSFMTSGVLNGATDSHCHILFGVDDGVRTLEEALSVLKYDEEAGITDVWCTPHIMEDSAPETATLKARFEELQQAYDGPVRLHLAAEYMLDTVFEQKFRDRDLLTMDNDTVLVETSTWTPPVGLYETFREIQSAGYRPLFAHPERYRYLNEPSYERLRKLGIHFQLNLPSLVGFYGDTAQQKAEWLLNQGYYTEIGSDCHRFRLIHEQFERKVLSKETIAKLRTLLEAAQAP
jgi:tyrosine-protein phosphatase YwqE